jgi:radical SAM superfamily enzyme YgiQ (UPF0313 family)
MHVLLISTYELGHQPLGLASPAAHLLAHGHSVQCCDLAVDPFDERAVADSHVVGISVPMHTALRLAVQAARRVRRINPTCHICFYGLYSSLNGEYLLHDLADSVIGAEFEQPLASLVDSLDSSGAGTVDGVWTSAQFSQPFLGRQTFVPPARHLLPPLARYAKLVNHGGLHLVGAVEASRGCAHTCLHCPITPVYGGRLRIVPEDIVLADIATLSEMGARHITFTDPDFFNGVKHSMRIVRRMHDTFPAMTFDATIKIEHIIEKRDLIAELRDLGCLFIVSAVEAISDSVLQHLEKGHTGAQVREALRIVRNAGLYLRPSLIPFTPWSTLDDYIDMMTFADDEGLVSSIDPVQYAIRLLLPPGSSLLPKPYTVPHLRGLDQENFSFDWCHPDERMDRLHQDVCRLVEHASTAREPRTVTYAKIADAAALAAGRPSGRSAHAAPAVEEPHLTEDWFC